MKKLNSTLATRMCKKSPSGLLISIWNDIALLSLTNYLGGSGIQVQFPNKTYHFQSLETLNKHNYGIVDYNGIAHGKMSKYNNLCNYVICNNVIVSGINADIRIQLHNGQIESSLLTI